LYLLLKSIIDTQISLPARKELLEHGPIQPRGTARVTEF
jgi:hypothetical protein